MSVNSLGIKVEDALRELFAEAEKNAPPRLSDKEWQHIMEQHAGDITTASYCPACGYYNWGHRLGCWRSECENSSKIGSVEWLFQARNGPILSPDAGGYIRHGTDFMFIDERPA